MKWVKENKILCKKIGIIVGVYLGMKYLVPLVIPFLLAGVIVCWSWPLIGWIKRRLHIRPPYVMAVLLILTAILLSAGCYTVLRWLGSLALRLGSASGAWGQAERILYDCCDSVSELFHMEACFCGGAAEHIPRPGPAEYPSGGLRRLLAVSEGSRFLDGGASGNGNLRAFFVSGF